MTGERRTLPQLAQAWSYSLDVLRAVVRRNPELQTLGIKFGATRAFSSVEADTIRAAYDAREKKKSQRMAVA